jgi:arginase
MSPAVGRVHLLGVPFNSKGRVDGVALGPAALRNAGLVQALTAAGIDLIDKGDVKLGPTTTERDPGSGLIAPTAVVEMIRAVRAEVQAIRWAGAFPLVIGATARSCLAASAVMASRRRPASFSSMATRMRGHLPCLPPARRPTWSSGWPSD